MSEPSPLLAATASCSKPNLARPQSGENAAFDCYVLLAHGSRDPAWQQPIERIAQAMQAKNQHAVCAYLERSTPDLDQALSNLHTQGMRNVRLVPLFLGIGMHVRSDLPSLLEQAQKKYPDLHLSMACVLGDSSAFTQAAANLIGDL